MIVVNGKPSAVAPGATLADLLAELALPERGVAVAVDAEVVPRTQWHTHTLDEGARVEIRRAIQGG